MQKKLILAMLAILSLTFAAKADVTEAISQMIYTEEKPSKGRRVTDSFYLFGVQGGITSIPSDGADPTFSAVFGYKHRISKSNFMYGVQLTGGHDIWGDGTGFFADIAPTISYMHFAGGFYNSFEATLGLGLGYRKCPSNTFAFTPELNLCYWFNWFSFGVTLRYSVQKDYEYYYYNYYVGSYSYYYDGNQFSVAARLAVRF